MIDFKRYPGAWLAVVFASGIALLLDTLVASGVRNGLRSESFETAQGVVTRSDITPGHKGALDHEVEYQYEVNGTRYTGTEYHVQPQMLGNRYWRAARDANPAGKAVTVYYDPTDPTDAYLVPGLRSDLLFVAWWATGVSLLALGLWLCVLEWLLGRRAFDPALRRCVRQTSDGWVARPDHTSRFAVTGFVALLATFAAGCFPTLAYAVALTYPPPWIVPLALYAAAPVVAVRLGLYWSRGSLLVINDRDGTVEFAHNSERVAAARADVLGADVTSEPRKDSNGQPYEVFRVSLRWRDKFDQEQTTALVEYAEVADAAALAAWLSERLELPGPVPVAV